jgi:hypothetical protein
LEFLANLKEAGSTNSMLDNMYGFEELNNLLGLPKIKELEQKFKGE